MKTVTIMLISPWGNLQVVIIDGDVYTCPSQDNRKFTRDFLGNWKEITNE